MGNGGGKAKVGSGRYSRTSAQDRTVNQIAKRTANLKNEQFRMVDEKGEVVVSSQGGKNEVRTTVGEKREYGNMAVAIHNHPDGGTFSPDDLRDFGYRVKEIVATTPEGVYRLINKKAGTREATAKWLSLKEKLEEIPEASLTQINRKAQENLKNSKTQKEIQKISETWAKIRETQGNEQAQAYIDKNKQRFDDLQAQHSRELKEERRRLVTEPFNEVLRKNAKEFGFIYRFEPWKKKKK